jgi:chitodextrinase
MISSRSALRLFLSTAAALILLSTVTSAQTIAFRQVNFAVPQTPQTTVTVKYTGAQLAGSLNVVVVGWSTTTVHVQSVRDSSGNTYVAPLAATVLSGSEAIQMYYAANIVAAAANANTVTVTFDAATAYPDIRIAEYSGIDPVNPLDGAKAATGNSSTSNSGTLVTTNPNDLLVAANNVKTTTMAPGTGFTSRLITSPDGNILEDRIVTTTGSYSAAAGLSGSGGWAMQVVAFRRASGGADAQPPTAPTNLSATATAAGQISLTWTASTDNVGVTGYRVERCQGAGCATFAQVGTPTASSYNDTGLIGSTNYSYRVRAVDAAGNLGGYSGTASATTLATSDTQPPTAPSNLSATALSSSQINLTWTASTDNVGVTGYRVERCQAAGCSTFAQVGTPTTTSYSDAGLTASTSYSYRVRATDGAGNFGLYSSVAGGTTTSTQSLSYPLKASSNNRYLVDQNNVPFLLVGDTGHALLAKLSEAEAATYLANRQMNHFNSVAVYAPCGSSETCQPDLSTVDGIRPFTSGTSPSNYDLATPNEAFYGRLDRIVNLAASYGIVVLLDPIETGNMLVTLQNNGATKAFNFGVYIGNRYKNFPNIIWQHGEDLQTWNTNPTNNGLVAQVMAGIASVDRNHLQTVMLDFNRSYSNQDTATLAPYLTFDLVYNYYETYDYVLAAYNSSPTLPVFLGESNYEDENNTGGLSAPAGAGVLRRQEYWTLLSGGVGHYYGNGSVNHFVSGWQNHLNTNAVTQVNYASNLLTAYRWWNLVPDQSHTVVTSGYGTYNANNLNLASANYATTSWIPDGTLSLTYCPTALTLTVNMARFGSQVTARWYDPSAGTFRAISGSPFTNSGTRTFATPGANGDGSSDWVLVLDAASGIVSDTQPPTAPTNLTATATSSTQINLGWTTATDNIGVVSYLVEACGGTGCTSFAQVGTSNGSSYSHTGLAASTSYSYRVRAADGAGNRGPYSGTASATTQTGSAPAPIAFRQSNYAVPQTPQTTVTVTFPSAQLATDLNVVVVGWSNATSHVASVTDTRGNVYTPALAPTVQTGSRSQIIYFAKNISAAAANANSVTITFDAAAPYPDVRIAEYSGIDPVNPVDAAVGASGTSATSNSGTMSTVSPSALLVAGNNVQNMTTGPGVGFTSRGISSPDGNILEDRVVTSAGSYSATASLGGNGGWVMQLVAFRGLSGGGATDTQAPTAPASATATAISSTRIDLTWTAASDNVGVTGYRVERCQGPGCSTFAQIGTATALSYSDATLTASTSYTYRIRATDAAGNLSPYSPGATATTTAQPASTLQIFLPADGSTISGTVTFGASATGGIVGMQFQIDNVNVGPVVPPGDTTPVNTAQFANGSHLIKAYGWDSQRNVFPAPPITVSFSNGTPGNPAQSGLWSGVFTTSLVSINMSLMGNGRVMMYDRLDLGNPDPQVWDPLTNSFLAAPMSVWTNLFCSGQVLLPDGRLFVAGGHAGDDIGLKAGRIYDPATNRWSSTPDMAVARWYPSLTVLPNGKVLVLSGEVGGRGDYAQIPEVYDPATNTWAQLSFASLSLPYYPHAFVLPNGKVAVTGTAELPVPARTLDVASQTWTTVDSRLFEAYSGAMYLPGKILKSGKSTNSLGSGPSVATAYVIDMTVATPQWRQVQSMAFPRAYHVETLLPDGSVLVTGGGRTVVDYDIANAVYAAELWSPTTETWTTLSSMQKPRLYHGSALLLPDGRVLVSGGGRSPGPDARDQLSLEIFAPPYLFKGPRPTISSAPAQLTRNQTFTIATPDAARIAKVTLVALGNMTHGINMSQRYLPLAFSTQAGQLTVTAPPDANTAPPGTYMLFVIDTQGVPSMASFTRF